MYRYVITQIPTHPMKIRKNVNIRTKVSYLKLKQNSFIILREEEMSSLRFVKYSKFMKIFRLESILVDGHPLAKEAGSGDAQPGGSGQEGRVCQG